MKEIFISGGPLMYVILLFSIVGLTVIIERFIYFIFIEQGSYDKIKSEIKIYVERKDINGAKAVCSRYNTSVSRVIMVILENIGDERDLLEEKIREVVLDEIPIMEKFMWLLGMAAHVTPLVGLLGTVTGMIKAFNVIAVQGVGKPEMLATGISEALITTASGLTVAIPAVIFYNYFNKKIDKKINEMEKAAVEFLNVLGG